MIRIAVFAFSAALLLLASSQGTIVRPLDEASRDPTLVAFRSALLRAIDHRDTAAVLSVVALGWRAVVDVVRSDSKMRPGGVTHSGLSAAPPRVAARPRVPAF